MEGPRAPTIGRLTNSHDKQNTQERSILLNLLCQFSLQAAIFPTIHAFSRQTGFCSCLGLSFTEFREFFIFVTEVAVAVTQFWSGNE
jgi:hypothetical protein